MIAALCTVQIDSISRYFLLMYGHWYLPRQIISNEGNEPVKIKIILDVTYL